MLRSVAVLLLWSALVLVLCPGSAAAEGELPESLRGALPGQLELEALSSSERLRFPGLSLLPHHGYLEHRLCLHDAELRERLLAGIRRLPAHGSPWLRNGYQQLALAPACSPDAAHCAWLSESLERETLAPASDFLWELLAFCWDLAQPQRFETADAPDAAVLRYHERQPRAVALHSERVEQIVRDRFAANEDERALQNALRVYARFDHPRTTATLLELLGRAPTRARQAPLWQAMRYQSDPVARLVFAASCRADLEHRLDAWRERGAPMRGSPLRWGSPCDGERFARLTKTAPLATPPAAEAQADPDSRLVRLAEGGPIQFKEDARLLRQLARSVRPDLDDAVFLEHWPAVDAVSLTRGPHTVQVFLNGDAVTLHVRDRAGEADLAQAEQIRQELEGALAEPREIDVYLRGERLRFVFAPEAGHRYAADRMLEIANTLLEHVGSPRRLVRLDEPHVIAVQVTQRR